MTPRAFLALHDKIRTSHSDSLVFLVGGRAAAFEVGSKRAELMLHDFPEHLVGCYRADVPAHVLFGDVEACRD